MRRWIISIIIVCSLAVSVMAVILGYNTPVGTDGTQGVTAGSMYLFTLGTMSEDGTLDSIVYYDSDVSDCPNMRIALYRYNAGDTTFYKIFASGDISVDGGGDWATPIACGSEALTSGWPLFVGVQAAATSDLALQYDYTADYYRRSQVIAYGAFPDTIANAALDSQDSRRISAYINYTASGGSGAGPKEMYYNTMKRRK